MSFFLSEADVGCLSGDNETDLGQVRNEELRKENAYAYLKKMAGKRCPCFLDNF